LFFKLWVIMDVWNETAVFLAGNLLREDFTFRHTFSAEVAKLLKASTGQIVVIHPEKFHSKHEPASHTLRVEVQCFISLPTTLFLSGFFFSSN